MTDCLWERTDEVSSCEFHHESPPKSCILKALVKEEGGGGGDERTALELYIYSANNGFQYQGRPEKAVAGSTQALHLTPPTLIGGGSRVAKM